MSINFRSLEELYNRILPALNVRCEEFSRMGYSVREQDIFNCLKQNKWHTKMNLTLYDLIHDILHVSIEEVNEFLERGGFE